MPPSMQVSVDYDNSVDASSLLEQAAMELSRITENELVPFPPNCYQLLRSIPGNQVCADCHSVEPDWASVCYGAVICMQCSGKHRSLGVQYSKVRSLLLDHWSHAQILKMLEGGNEQLNTFFHRHSLSAAAKRYRTKAAQFYRNGIEEHVRLVASHGTYQGRRASRRLSEQPENQCRLEAAEPVVHAKRQSI